MPLSDHTLFAVSSLTALSFATARPGRRHEQRRIWFETRKKLPLSRVPSFSIQPCLSLQGLARVHEWVVWTQARGMSSCDHVIAQGFESAVV